MIPELWRVFPRLLEENIEGLLDTAQPTALRALEIFRAFRSQGLWSGSIDKFSRDLESFFLLPRVERRKSRIDVLLSCPMSHDTYSLFDLDFRTAAVKEDALLELASWAHNLIRVSKKKAAPFASLEVLTATLRRLTSPGRNDKAKGLRFSDFCASWKNVVFRQFGTTHDHEFDELLKELDWLNNEIQKSDRLLQEAATTPSPAIGLSPVELDWTRAVRQAAIENRRAPEFPLAGGPELQSLKDLERITALFTISFTSRLPAIIENKEKIRATLLHHSNQLLKAS